MWTSLTVLAGSAVFAPRFFSCLECGSRCQWLFGGVHKWWFPLSIPNDHHNRETHQLWGTPFMDKPISSKSLQIANDMGQAINIKSSIKNVKWPCHDSNWVATRKQYGLSRSMMPLQSGKHMLQAKSAGLFWTFLNYLGNRCYLYHCLVEPL